MELVRNFVVNDWGLKIVFVEPDRMDAPVFEGESVAAPGSGRYEIKQMQLAADKIEVGESLTLSAEISAENIAFLSTEVYLKDKELDYYYGPLMQDFVRSSEEKENNGLIHPVWGADINLSLEITPILRVLTDGEAAAFAFMQSVDYGQESVQLEGLFTKKGSGNSNRARLKFDSSGEMTDKRVIQEKRGRLVTHDLAIKTGDMFVPVVHVLTGVNLSNPKMTCINGLSDTLTKMEESFHWVDEAAIPGDYLLGLVIEDFNGDQTRHFIPFTISGNQE